jgi:hypothetical protein
MFRPRVALARATLRRSGGRKVHWTFRYCALTQNGVMSRNLP